MQSTTKCERCGTHIPQATSGLCPKCLLAEGIPTFVADVDVTIDSSPNVVSGETKPVGEFFGDYELLEEIARGGMGIVYRARDQRLNRIVALKMILAGQFASESEVERFKREAEAAANLDHSGIVPVYEIGEHDGHHFFAMKLIEGGSLSDRFAELKDGTPRCIELLRNVALAVHHAHQRGILHRDLKPANVLLDAADTPLVTDLGLAKDVGSGSDLTQSGAIVGTPAYMSPEQAAGKSDVTTATDIYSIGAMLYESLTGQPPHRADTPMATLLNVMDSDAAPPSSINRDVDRQLELICLKCLEREPEQRYSSAAALADDLNNWLEGSPISLKPPSINEQLFDFLKSNVRTALGAGIVGTIAGVALAFFGSRASWSNDVINTPAATIYETMGSPIPIGRAFAFQSETEINGLVGALSLLGITLTCFFGGLLVALVARPKTVRQAFAVGSVAALLMSIAYFAFGLGPGMSQSLHRTARNSVMLLSDMALSDPERAAESREQLFENYPGLANVAPEEQAKTISYRIFYDSSFGYSLTMVVAIAMNLLLCVIPCVAGTCYATKLFEIRSTLFFALSYFEFMAFVLWLDSAICFQTLVPLFADVPDGGLIGRYGLQLYVYSTMALMCVMIYRRRFKWWFRWGVYLGLTAISFLIF